MLFRSCLLGAKVTVGPKVILGAALGDIVELKMLGAGVTVGLKVGLLSVEAGGKDRGVVGTNG